MTDSRVRTKECRVDKSHDRQQSAKERMSSRQIDKSHDRQQSAKERMSSRQIIDRKIQHKTLKIVQPACTKTWFGGVGNSCSITNSPFFRASPCSLLMWYFLKSSLILSLLSVCPFILQLSVYQMAISNRNKTRLFL